MRTLVLAVTSLLLSLPAFAQTQFTTRTVATDLVIPWEIELGPDGYMWLTERPGIFSKIDMSTGEKIVMLDRRDSVHAVAETGMMGFDWHPDYPDSPYVYVAMVYGFARPDYRVVNRYTVDTQNFEHDTLIDPFEIFRETPSSYSHQGCRIKVGPDRKLWVTTGDNYTDDGLKAQDKESNLGKVLRMNFDGSAPEDNPEPGLLMWSYGHRNVQGLTFLPNGNIFTSEHGDAIEDEVNFIKKGANYGWPYVEGPCDADYEEDFCSSENPEDPAFSSGNDRTFAMCGLEFYDHDRYPSLKRSLLLATLKRGTLFQLHLNEDMDEVVDTDEHLNFSVGRIRDFAITDDGRIFICTSNRQILAQPPFPFAEDDRILELIPVDPEGKGTLDAPDFYLIKARPGDELQFLVPISNTGDAPYKVTNIVNQSPNPELKHQHWRFPLYVDAGVDYGLACLFAPTEEGEQSSRISVTTEDGQERFITLQGSTDVGLLLPVLDTTFIRSQVGIPELKDVEFTNTGTQPITIDSVVLRGARTNFRLVKGYSGIVEPNQTVNVQVEYTPQWIGSHSCHADAVSDSYRPASAFVFGTGEPVSVDEGDTPLPLSVFPNPFHEEVTIFLGGLPFGNVTITDMLGRQHYHAPFIGQETVTWNAAAPAGTYVVTIESASKRHTLLIQRMHR